MIQNNSKNIAILGTGSYGIGLAKRLVDNDCNVTMWTSVKDEYEMLIRDRVNKVYLQDYYIDNRILIKDNLEETIKEAQIIFIAIPVKYVMNTIKELKKYYQKNQIIVVACKGIIQDSLSFVSYLIKNELNCKNIAVISGGTFAIDMIKDDYLALTVASKKKKIADLVKSTLENKYLSMDITNDVFGVEMYGAIKNVMAITLGIANGYGYCESTKSLLITRFINDTAKMIEDFSGNKMTMFTYAGIGDIWLTATSPTSRNYAFGNLVGKKSSQQEINDYLKNTTVEGYYTLKSLYELFKKNNYKMEIIDILYSIIYDNKDISLLEEYLSN